MLLPDVIFTDWKFVGTRRRDCLPRVARRRAQSRGDWTPAARA